MKKSDAQLGKPQILFKGTTAELEAVSAVEGMEAYDTTLQSLVVYDGTKWGQVSNESYNSSTLPVSPNIYDDEFLGTSLDAAWSVQENTAADVDFSIDWHSWLKIYFSGGGSYEIRKDFSPTTDFSMTAKFSFPPQANYQGVKIGAFNSDFSEGAIVVYEFSTNVLLQLGTKDNNIFNWNRISRTFNSDGTPILSNSVYLHLQRISNNWYIGVSSDGISFYKHSSQYAKTFTVAKMYIRLSQEGATIPAYYGLDWFRYNWIML